MKTTTLCLAAITAALMTSDMFHASALRHWNDGQAAIGMNLISHAGRINPFSFNVRLDQIESLYAGFRKTHERHYLSEIVMIARDLSELFPGNAQAQAIYADALIYARTHGAGSYPPFVEAAAAVDMDPLSVAAIEANMFLLASARHDLPLFKSLGMRRARLTSEPLTMKCKLCGRQWLEHKEKSK